jgi:hypothetical protein
VTQIRCYETSGQPVFINGVLHRRLPYLKNFLGQIAPLTLPDVYETTKFLFRLISPFFKLAAVLNPEPLNPLSYPGNLDGYVLSGQGHSLCRGQMGHFGFLAAHVSLPK